VDGFSAPRDGSDPICRHDVLRGALADVSTEHVVHQLALSEIDLPVADRRENCPEYSVRRWIVLAEERRGPEPEILVDLRWIRLPGAVGGPHESEHLGYLLFAHRRRRPSRTGGAARAMSDPVTRA
jgi:hypothetical protein